MAEIKKSRFGNKLKALFSRPHHNVKVSDKSSQVTPNKHDPISNEIPKETIDFGIEQTKQLTHFSRARPPRNRRLPKAKIQKQSLELQEYSDFPNEPRSMIELNFHQDINDEELVATRKRNYMKEIYPQQPMSLQLDDLLKARNTILLGKKDDEKVTNEFLKPVIEENNDEDNDSCFSSTSKSNNNNGSPIGSNKTKSLSEGDLRHQQNEQTNKDRNEKLTKKHRKRSLWNILRLSSSKVRTRKDKNITQSTPRKASSMIESQTQTCLDINKETRHSYSNYTDLVIKSSPECPAAL